MEECFGFWGGVGIGLCCGVWLGMRLGGPVKACQGAAKALCSIQKPWARTIEHGHEDEATFEVKATNFDHASASGHGPPTICCTTTNTRGPGVVYA